MKFGPAFTTMINQNLDDGIVPALMGEPGIGKSSFLEDLATQRGSKCFTVPCNQLADKADLTGGRLLQYTRSDGSTDYHQTFYPYEDISAAIDYALEHPDERPILFLDEINRTSSDVTSGALSLSTARRIGRKRLPENLSMAVAGNLKGDVVNLDDASLSRFAIYRVEPDAQTFLALHPELNQHIVSVLTDYPECIFSKGTPNVVAVDGSDDAEIANFADVFEAGEDMVQITTPRTIVNLSKWLNTVEKNDPSLFGQLLGVDVEIEGRTVTELNEAVEVYIGNTELATRVVGKIAEAIQSVTQAPAAAALTEPDCYDAIRGARSITDLEAVITGLDQADRVASLIYAITERADNARVIDQLANHIDQLESQSIRQLIELMNNRQYHAPNVQALIGGTSTVGAAVNPILSPFL